MSKQYKILFISAPIGAGHIKAARAISLALEKENAHIDTQIVNVFDFFNPHIGQAILKIYLKILKIFPKLYGMAYSWGNESYLALLGRKMISSYLAKHMEKYIKEYQPTVIVCTHATPAGLVAHLLKNNKLTIPVFAVITDFVVHRLWIYPEIKNYIVAHKAMRDFLFQYGIKKNSVEVLGIPVDEKFSQEYDTYQLLQNASFTPACKTILIMGGGAGLLPMDEIILACEKSAISLQLIAVTGHNESMYQKLITLQPRLKQKLLTLKYVDNVSELMSIADLIISKPGGVTTAETLCRGLPMLIYKPIPGQEEGNTKYLTACEAALCADSVEEIGELVEKVFIKEPNLLETLKKNAIKLSQPQSAYHISQRILQQCK